MSLLAPLGLFALLALPVIVILHMMRSRRRRTVVPSLLLWRQIPLRSAARRRRLRFTLLLWLHLLVAFLIGLALAQPHISFPWLGSNRTTAIIIDTSISMTLSEAGSSRLERVKERASALISQMRGADRVALISAGPVARLIDHGSSVEMARLLAALAQMNIEGVGSDFSGALTIAETLLLDQPNPQVIWLTDGALPPPNVTTLRVPLQIEVVGSPQPNRAVVTLAARSGQAGVVYVYARLANYGSQPFRGPVRLLVDGQLNQTELVNIRPGAVLELTWTLPGAARQVQLTMNGADGLPLDDSATVNVSGQHPIQVLLVADEAPALVRALQAMPEVTLRTVAPARYAPDPTVDLTIFVNTLPARWPAGGVLVINPPPDGLVPISGFRQAATTVTLTASGAALLGDINLGGINWGQIAMIEPLDGLTLLALSGDIPLILRGRIERSEIAIWNFDLNNSQLSGRLAFPLLVARTTRDLAPPPLPAVLPAGTPFAHQADIRTTLLELIDPTGKPSTFPLQPGLPMMLELNQVGIYQLREWADDQLVREAYLPVNAGAIDESDPTPRFASAVHHVPPIAVPAKPVDTPQPLWSWFIMAAITVLVGEWLYIQQRSQVEAQ
ncbi:MAG: BatA and WFA domain-containing protein [Chloroflexus sp.]